MDKEKFLVVDDTTGDILIYKDSLEELENWIKENQDPDTGSYSICQRIKVIRIEEKVILVEIQED